MQNFRFQFTPKQIPVVILLLVMLALPVGLVIWGLKRPDAGDTATAGDAPTTGAQGPAEPLRQSLESIADGALAPAPLVEEARDQVLIVVDPDHAAGLAGKLAGELGGTALPPGTADDGSVRVVFTIPEGERAEFARRLGLVAGTAFELPSAGGLIAVRFERASRP